MSDTKILNQTEWHRTDRSYSDLLERDTFQKSVEYWKSQFEGVEMLELATDYPRLPVQTYQGGYEEFQINPSLTNKLNELARGQDATMYLVLLAAFKVLLSRYSGQRDIAVG